MNDNGNVTEKMLRDKVCFTTSQIDQMRAFIAEWLCSLDKGGSTIVHAFAHDRLQGLLKDVVIGTPEWFVATFSCIGLGIVLTDAARLAGDRMTQEGDGA